MINLFGGLFLVLSFFLCLSSIVSGFVGVRRDSESLSDLCAQFGRASFYSLSIAVVILLSLLVNDNYINHYVWQFSNRDMPYIYKLTALWGGMNGSMMLWAFLVSTTACILTYQRKLYPQTIYNWTLPTSQISALFFIGVTAFATNPFEFIKANFIPVDGNGLNPLLQNPYMAIHPPMLYLGFTTFAVPFAFCMGALLSGDLKSEWLYAVRKWTQLAWGFLTAGIVLGGFWAYIELGWGGFWAWDPVENSSFLPWLTGTAFLHSSLVQERKGILKGWNIWLCILTYGLTVFGTFLTRSGIVQSVHAFASTDIGWIFLTYLGLILATALFLTVRRQSSLKSERSIESLLSREAFFLFNNLFFVTITFAVVWGVMFPVLSEAITGKKQTVSIPYFNTVTLPLFLGMLFLMGCGTFISWRKDYAPTFFKQLLSPVISAVAVGGVFLWAGITSFYPVLSYAICTFVLHITFREFHRGVKAQSDKNGSYGTKLLTMITKQPRRFGGYIVHIGVLIVTIGITASMAHKIEKEFTLSKGEKFTAGAVTVSLEDLYSVKNDNYEALVADTAIINANSDAKIADLHPELRLYTRKKETTSEVALSVSMKRDIYLVLAGLSEDGEKASFKIFINPLQVWLWIGAIIMILGTVVLLLAPPKKVSEI